MAADFDNFNYKNHKLDCILTFISGLEVPEYAIHSLKAIVLYDFFENQQNNDKYTKYLDAEIIEKNLSLFDIAIYLGHTTGILFPEQLSRYINRFLVQLERINIPNFNDQCSRHNHLADDYFESYTETVPLCDVLKLHGYDEHAELFTHDFLKKNTLKYLAYDIFSLRDRLEIPVVNDFPKQYFPNVPTFNEVFFNYIDKATYSYTRYKYTKYISDWLYRRVILQQWRQFYNIDIFVLFTSWQLDNKLINDIFDHALSLYLQYVVKYFNAFYKKHFDIIQDKEIKSKLALKIKEIIINLSIGDISGIDTEFAKSNLRIGDINLISKQLLNANDLSHHTLSNINIHNANSTVVADALIKYKEFIDLFLNPNSIKNNPAPSIDYRFNISDDFFDTCSSKLRKIFDWAKGEIDSKNFIERNAAPHVFRIFTPKLATFLLSSYPFNVININKNEPATIYGSEYLDDYIAAFKEGEKHFDDNFSIDCTDMKFICNGNPDLYKKTLQSHYFPRSDEDRHLDNYWGWVVRVDPETFSHNIIKKHGYASGIVSKVKSIILKFPDAFKDFYQSNDDVSTMDLTFQLADDFLDTLSEKNKSIFDYASSVFSKGFISIDIHLDHFKFYNLQLYSILFFPDPLNVTIPLIDKQFTLKGSDFLKTYFDAYKEGEEFFVKTYNFDQYKPEALVETIKLLYFPKDKTNIYNRNYWSYVKIMNPFIISHAIVKDYGYNSGIINKVQKLIEIHPILFKDFYSDGVASTIISKIDIIDDNMDNPLTTKIATLKTALYKYGFFSIPSIASLTEDKQIELVQKIAINNVPYQIAMFNYLGYLDFLLLNFADNKKKKLFPLLSKHILFSSERTIKGNISILSTYSKENPLRYTSNTFAKLVSADYSNLGGV